ncbi:hypothetical protein B0H19DRAFT_848919, partial [Mycena capillaripes]
IFLWSTYAFPLVGTLARPSVHDPQSSSEISRSHQPSVSASTQTLSDSVRTPAHSSLHAQPSSGKSRSHQSSVSASTHRLSTGSVHTTTRPSSSTHKEITSGFSSTSHRPKPSIISSASDTKSTHDSSGKSVSNHSSRIASSSA